MHTAPLIDVPARAEALAWAQRIPAPCPGLTFCIELHSSMGGIDLPPEDADRLLREEFTAIRHRR